MKFKELLGLVRFLSNSGGIKGFIGVIEHAEQEIMSMSDLVPAGDQAVMRLDTAPPGAGVNVMIGGMPLRQKMSLLPTFLKVTSSVGRCGQYMYDKQSPSRSDADHSVWTAIDQLARENGAVEVGFVRIDEHDIFEGFAIPYRNAIVFTVDMEKEAIDTAPSFDAMVEVLQTYASLGQVALKLTDFLRDQGYGAYPGFPIRGVVDYVRAAEQAGIGAIGYHGMLISPTDGTRQRINLVLTNMEIPEPTPNPHEWILDFCAMCNKCVRECPPEAIFTTAEVNPVNGRKSTIHYDRCVEYYGQNQGCAVCVRVCPFSQAGYDKIMSGFLRRQASRQAA
ncbi:MAG: 4Fe-4S dicluster domain-containing protein [Ardenticatenaceae bacterium]|nr:4Fe-4S dicluster domain-containing protein [Ardenticatenaceae bacterium]